MGFLGLLPDVVRQIAHSQVDHVETDALDIPTGLARLHTSAETATLLAMAARLPTMFGERQNVEDGGLMSYGIDVRESWRRTAAFVDKILKGTKPGDLPIEFPTKLELVIDLTAAKILDLTIPPTLLARADEVIE